MCKNFKVIHKLLHGWLILARIALHITCAQPPIPSWGDGKPRTGMGVQESGTSQINEGFVKEENDKSTWASKNIAQKA